MIRRANRSTTRRWWGRISFTRLAACCEGFFRWIAAQAAGTAQPAIALERSLMSRKLPVGPFICAALLLVINSGSPAETLEAEPEAMAKAAAANRVKDFATSMAI